jgi:ABC-2 type transport system ATP-binding protein
MFSPALALVVLAGFGCSALLKAWQVRRSMAREHDYIETSAKAQQEMIETIRAIATVKLFRKEADREARWTDRHIQSVNARYDLDRIRTTADIGREAIQALTLILVAFLGARQVIGGTTTLGMLMAFITYQQMFATSASALLDFAGRFRLLDVHLQRLADVVLEEPEEDEIALQGGRLHGLSGALAVRNLSFRYAAIEDTILNDISFDIAPGEFVAITGPSGGGKTTLMRAVVGVQAEVRGRVDVLGEPAGHPGLRRRVGYVTQDPAVYGDLSVRHNLAYFADVLGTERGRVDEVVRDVALTEAVDQRVDTLSGGQRARVSLAAALLSGPELLVLDEPTVGLDPVLRRDLWDMFAALAAAGTTLLVSSHVMDEAARCDRLLLLREGRLVADDTLPDLLARTGTTDVEAAFLSLAVAA